MATSGFDVLDLWAAKRLLLGFEHCCHYQPEESDTMAGNVLALRSTVTIGHVKSNIHRELGSNS